MKEGLAETDRELEPLESYMQQLPDHMPIPLLSLAGRSDPGDILQLLQNGFRVFRFTQNDNLTTIVSQIDEYIDTQHSEFVLIWPSKNSSDLDQLQYIDYKQHETLEDIRGKILLLAGNGNGLGDKVAVLEIPQGERDIHIIQEHFTQCATYDNFHKSDNTTVITVTDKLHDLLHHFPYRKGHMTCGIVVGKEGESSDIVNINSRYHEMVQLTINSSDMVRLIKF